MSHVEKQNDETESWPMKSMNVTIELAKLDEKIRAFLPPQYQHCYGSVSPTSMGSAGLIYGDDGKVAWEQIWTSFCDLALAGGPPHRGKLLEPVSEADVAAESERYAEVVTELTRAIRLTTGVKVAESTPGWVDMKCSSVEEASWLQFAITAENVTARRKQRTLQLPAGPAFRVEKEIKNVVVALAKTLHYWDSHLTLTQQALAGDEVWEAAPPTAADLPAHQQAREEMEAGLRAAGLSPLDRKYTGWVGIETPEEQDAVWILRAVLVDQVLARREENILYLPVHAEPDPAKNARVIETISYAWDLWVAHSFQKRKWARKT